MCGIVGIVARRGAILKRRRLKATAWARIERENIFAEYNQRIGEVVNGTVKRFENGDIILEVGRIEASVATERDRARSVGEALDNVERSEALGVAGDARQPRLDGQTRAVLHRRIADEA